MGSQGLKHTPWAQSHILLGGRKSKCWFSHAQAYMFCHTLNMYAQLPSVASCLDFELNLWHMHKSLF